MTDCTRARWCVTGGVTAMVKRCRRGTDFSRWRDRRWIFEMQCVRSINQASNANKLLQLKQFS